ncbi:MAG: hypothetical protein R3A47_10750 [Polyangiales bacterium]
MNRRWIALRNPLVELAEVDHSAGSVHDQGGWKRAAPWFAAAATAVIAIGLVNRQAMDGAQTPHRCDNDRRGPSCRRRTDDSTFGCTATTRTKVKRQTRLCRRWTAIAQTEEADSARSVGDIRCRQAGTLVEREPSTERPIEGLRRSGT